MAESMLVEALPARIDRFLDLGTGDGRLLSVVRGVHPGARGIGIDSSTLMLERARSSFTDDSRIELRPHDLNKRLPDAGKVDVVVSALTIHHLRDGRKRSLFAEIYSALVPGGVFINLDLVAAVTPERHRRFREAIGRLKDDPTDHLGDMGQQLRWLHEVGFAEVECEFKWLELALIVAVRAPGSP
jgi:SAM-dependent methyltransferase